MESGRKKIGLLTLDSRSYNYGGLLQEYALWRIVNSLGYQCEVIDYDMSSEPGMFSYKRSLRYLTPRKIFNKLKEKKEADRDISEVITPRHERFDGFRHDYMKLSPRCGHNDLAELQKNYDAIVCGSDQIWSPSQTRPSFFLDFVDEERRKVIYAASISRDKLSREEAKVYKKYLSGFDAVSVREEKAREIVLELNPNLDVTVVLDPTLLLDQRSWKQIAGGRPLVGEPYVFCYFLGIDEQKRKAAVDFAEKKGIRSVSLPYLLGKYNVLDEGFSKDLFPAGPAEFLNLIMHAEYVLTDSFHASVFSILFGRAFRVFGRNSGKQNMNSRLETLLGYIRSETFLIEPAQLADCKIDNNQRYDLNVLLEKKELSMKWINSRIRGGVNNISIY